MPVQSYSYLTFARDPEAEIFDLDTVQADDILMLRDHMNEEQEYNREMMGSKARFASLNKQNQNR